MSVFALVHGAWHGGWCWELLAPELEARGHRVVAPDLPCEDVSAGLEEYARVVDEALGDADDVVVVGHSLGGLTIPLVAARRPVRRLVYLCAIVPQPGRSLNDLVAAEPAIFPPGFAPTIRDELGRSHWTTAEAAIDYLYGDVPHEAALGAYRRLLRQAQAPSVEPCPLAALPDVPVTSIVCTGDRAVSPLWSIRVAREWLGVEPFEIPGSHSPFLSRPDELAALLDSL